MSKLDQKYPDIRTRAYRYLQLFVDGEDSNGEIMSHLMVRLMVRMWTRMADLGEGESVHQRAVVSVCILRGRVQLWLRVDQSLLTLLTLLTLMKKITLL